MGGPAWLHPSCGQSLPRLPASLRKGPEGCGPAQPFLTLVCWQCAKVVGILLVPI